MESQPAFPESVPGVDDVAPIPEITTPALEAPVPEVIEAPEQDFNWGSFAEPSSASTEREPEPSRVKSKLGPMGQVDMAEFFSEEGIGKIFARGVDGFYKTCGAEEMDRTEFNQVSKVFAYWCQARLPSDAKDYQPEILLMATLAMTTMPRMGPVVQAAAPWWARGWRWVRGILTRTKEPSNVEPS